MTKNDINRMAREAKLVIDGNNSGDDDLLAFANLVAAHKAEVITAEAYPQPPLPVQLVAYDKTEMNSFVIDLYEEKMKEGKHGHYEALLHCVHQAIARVTSPAAPLPVQEPVAWEQRALNAQIDNIKEQP